jgi:hypothetical protein
MGGNLYHLTPIGRGVHLLIMLRSLYYADSRGICGVKGFFYDFSEL